MENVVDPVVFREEDRLAGYLLLGYEPVQLLIDINELLVNGAPYKHSLLVIVHEVEVLIVYFKEFAVDQLLVRGRHLVALPPLHEDIFLPVVDSYNPSLFMDE